MSLLTFERNLLLKNKVNFLFPLLLVVLFAFPLFFDHKLAYTEFDELNHNYEEMQRLIETLKEDENEKEFVESLEKSDRSNLTCKKHRECPANGRSNLSL